MRTVLGCNVRTILMSAIGYAGAFTTIIVLTDYQIADWEWWLFTASVIWVATWNIEAFSKRGGLK